MHAAGHALHLTWHCQYLVHGAPFVLLYVPLVLHARSSGVLFVAAAGHPFCAECICRWRQRSWRCPVCRVMDGRELTVPPPAAGGGSPGQQRRLGGAGHMSQRLRPMAEQMLAESGDNVLDVLLQLLEVLCHQIVVEFLHCMVRSGKIHARARLSAGTCQKPCACEG